MSRLNRFAVTFAALLIAVLAATGGAFAQKIPAQRCGGFFGQLCSGPNQYCSFKFQCGFGDVMGQCMAKPARCPRNFDPVCGCNGKTYPNDCERRKAGTSLMKSGKCA